MFRKRLYANLQRGPTDLTVCVPYIGQIPGFRNIFQLATYFERQGGKNLIVITGPPAKTADQAIRQGRLSRQVAGLLAGLDFVELYVRSSPFLHAKLYHLRFPTGQGIGYIGSSNLTKGGLQDNDEVMGEIVNPAEERKVLAQLRQLAGHGAVAYHAWRRKTVTR